MAQLPIFIVTPRVDLAHFCQNSNHASGRYPEILDENFAYRPDPVWQEELSKRALPPHEQLVVLRDRRREGSGPDLDDLLKIEVLDIVGEVDGLVEGVVLVLDAELAINVGAHREDFAADGQNQSVIKAAGYLGYFFNDPCYSDGLKLLFVSADTKLSAAIVSKHHEAPCVVDDSGVV